MDLIGVSVRPLARSGFTEAEAIVLTSLLLNSLTSKKIFLTP